MAQQNPIGVFDLDTVGGSIERDTVIMFFGSAVTGLTLATIAVMKWNKDQTAWGATDVATAVVGEIGQGYYEVLIDAVDRDVIGAGAYKGVSAGGDVAVTVVNVGEASKSDGGSSNSPNIDRPGIN